MEIQTTLHPVNRWVLIEVDIAGRETVVMVLDTGSPIISTISAGLRERLARAGLLPPVSGRPNRFLLSNLKIQNQSIEDLEVRVSPITTRAGADGTLGLDFLTRYRDIHFHVPTLRLTLT